MDWAKQIFSVTENNFEDLALEIYRHQFDRVPVYNQFCICLHRTPDRVCRLADIPFLPIEFFKSQRVVETGLNAEVIFESSGTTASTPSKHYVADIALYRESFIRAFELFYGSAKDYAILSLLPSYLEREHSSLVYMARELMDRTEQEESGFYLTNFDALHQALVALKGRKQKTILLGVTFALLDFAEQFPIDFPELIVMETGGMKGRREEMTRQEVHERLRSSFGVKNIHSEYGMTELLSQAYSSANGIFHNPPWMKIALRDLYDPMDWSLRKTSGAVNVIDLANVHSCSFIATGDVGQMLTDGTFKILGRMEQAEIRGCNLMVVSNNPDD